MSAKKKPGRPVSDKPNKVHITARIEQSDKDELIKRYGTMSKAINALIKNFKSSNM